MWAGGGIVGVTVMWGGGGIVGVTVMWVGGGIVGVTVMWGGGGIVGGGCGGGCGGGGDDDGGVGHVHFRLNCSRPCIVNRKGGRRNKICRGKGN